MIRTKGTATATSLRGGARGPNSDSVTTQGLKRTGEKKAPSQLGRLPQPRHPNKDDKLQPLVAPTARTRLEGHRSIVA